MRGVRRLNSLNISLCAFGGNIRMPAVANMYNTVSEWRSEGMCFSANLPCFTIEYEKLNQLDLKL